MQSLTDGKKKPASPPLRRGLPNTHTENPTTTWSYILDSKEENHPKTGKF